MTQLYTPWMTQAGQTMGNAIAQRGQNQLYSSAYMGEPGAMERLMQVNPAMGQQLVQQRQQAEQLKLEHAAKLRAEDTAKIEKIKKMAGEKRVLFEDIKKRGSKLDTFEEFDALLETEREALRPEYGSDVDLLPKATPEMFAQTKQIYGEKPEKPDKPDQFQGLIASWKSAPEGSEEKRLLEAKIAKEVSQSGGMKISYDAEGRPVIETGVSGGIEKKTQGVVEADLLSQTDQLSKLENITKTFDEDYQTLGKKVNALMTGGKSFLGLDVSPEDEEAYNKMVDQRANIGELTTTIRNDLFGSALTDTERKSANVFLPNVESDNPLELKRKTERMLKTAKRAVARLNYIRKNGFELTDVSLDKMDDVMSNRAKELHNEIKTNQPELSEENIKSMVLQSVRKEFGLVR